MSNGLPRPAAGCEFWPTGVRTASTGSFLPPIGAATAGGGAPSSASHSATWLLIGDLAFLHDTSALVGLAARGLPLRLVIVDNNGGGIFSFLPQAAALDNDVFETFWGTPQAVDLVALATAHGLPARRADDARGVAEGLAWLAEQPGTAALVVSTDRAANVIVHDRLNRAVAAALQAG